MVDVTHDGDDGRPLLERLLATLIRAELQIEGLQQLAVFVFRRDDLDDIVELLAEQLKGGVVDRLGRSDHLPEVEEHLHQRGWVDADLVGEVGQRSTTSQANGLAVALADTHAANRGGFHLLKLLTTGALGLAATTRGTTGTTEGALGAATTTGATAWSSTGTTWGTAWGTAAGSAAEAATTRSATATGSTSTGSATTWGATATGSATGTTRAATTTRTGAECSRRLGHHRRVGARHPVTSRWRPGRALRLVSARRLGRRATTHALGG